MTLKQPIAIVSAMHDELAHLLTLMPDEQKQTRAGREFWLGHLHGHLVVLVLSGIGKVAAATTATLLIEHFHADQCPTAETLTMFRYVPLTINEINSVCGQLMVIATSLLLAADYRYFKLSIFI